ncbi:MAG: stage III sporulation protein AB, partial [Oscillospiraceae bacterium]|nr:stage III sporulation protein AB [Oscillospiraceae bacterium]
MLKTIGLGLLFFACGFTGAWLTRGLTLRVRELEAVLRMLSTLRTQMQFSRAPLEAMLTQVCAQEQPPRFLPRCLEGLRGGEAFPRAWRGALEQGGSGG